MASKRIEQANKSAIRTLKWSGILAAFTLLLLVASMLGFIGERFWAEVVPWLATLVFLLGLPLSAALGVHNARDYLGDISNELLLLYGLTVAVMNASALGWLRGLLKRTDSDEDVAPVIRRRGPG